MGKAGTHRPNGGFSLASQMKPGKPLKKASQRAWRVGAGQPPSSLTAMFFTRFDDYTPKPSMIRYPTLR
uniref:Uncharacterized protein n=1 Tax=Picea sitchensis TaxID=3332 RepID=A0A6B9XXN8_PICSI|nr:hypothetical protein Q903MT_gene6831 [Picea sitchensis]